MVILNNALIYGGYETQVATSGREDGNNICVMGSALDCGIAPKLTINGGMINGDIELFRYDVKENDVVIKAGLTPQLVLTGAPIIQRSIEVNGETKTAVAQDGLNVLSGVLADISGLTAGARIEIEMDTPGVFTNNLVTLTPETAKTYFVANINHSIVVQGDQLAVVKNN